MSRAVLVLGATSSIARAACYAFAEKGDDLFLTSRDPEELKRLAADIHVRYPNIAVHHRTFDALKYDTHADFFIDVVRTCPNLEGVLVAFGDLGDQKVAINDFSLAKRTFDINFTGACSILTHCANYFSKKGSGFIIGISSVAGDRGRRGNYIYGASKAALTTFLDGLRNRLYHNGVHVMNVKPGYTDTAMTFSLEGKFLEASPQRIGRAIVKALDRKRNTVYLPWYWRWVMLILKAIPEPLFKRLKL
ncbi:MAG: SDR family oxidoreductase [Chlamydiales bacterium]|nr:SDR family oxidoreductase [Chlamydiia bacterium]MCP5508057.1 SDR family oxidoreductase [Chlamydiales bacterium]